MALKLFCSRALSHKESVEKNEREPLLELGLGTLPCLLVPATRAVQIVRVYDTPWHADLSAFSQLQSQLAKWPDIPKAHLPRDQCRAVYLNDFTDMS